MLDFVGERRVVPVLLVIRIEVVGEKVNDGFVCFRGEVFASGHHPVDQFLEESVFGDVERPRIESLDDAEAELVERGCLDGAHA